MTQIKTVQSGVAADLTHAIIGCAIEVHRELGPGLLESAYEACLCHELGAAGIAYQQQVPLPVEYKGIRIDCGYRIDLLIENQIVVEIKSIETMNRVHEAQLLTYMRLANKRVGLLINFNSKILKDGIVRRVL